MRGLIHRRWRGIVGFGLLALGVAKLPGAEGLAWGAALLALVVGLDLFIQQVIRDYDERW